MNKLIISGIVASVALSAFVLILQNSSAPKSSGQTALSSSAAHLAISAPIKKPKGPIILPPPTL